MNPGITILANQMYGCLCGATIATEAPTFISPHFTLLAALIHEITDGITYSEFKPHEICPSE